MLNETARSFEFLHSQASGNRSFSEVLVAQGQSLGPGQVLGEVTATPGVYAAYDASGNDGTETAKAVLVSAIDTTAEGTNADTICTIVARDAEVVTGLLVGADAAALVSLEAAGIIARKSLGEA